MSKRAIHRTCMRWSTGRVVPALVVLLPMCLLTSCATSQQSRSQDVMERIAELGLRWERAVVPVGTEPQVFYDDALVASRSTNMVRRIGKAQKHNGGEPIVVADRAWEIGRERWGVGGEVSVIERADGKYQMWYAAGSRPGLLTMATLGYAESDDGIRWEKPLVLPGINNIVLSPCFGAGVYLDSHDTRWLHRYKAVYGTVGLWGASSTKGLNFAHSRDGRHWSAYDDVEPLDAAWSDTLHNLFWDDEIELYRLYTRIMLEEYGRSSRQFVRRYVGSSRWLVLARAFFLPVAAEPWLHVGDTGLSKVASIYSLTVHKYGSIYVGYLALFRGAFIDFCLATSRNGLDWNFDWAAREHAVIDRGAPGSPDGGMLYPPATSPVEVGDEWQLFYSGCRLYHVVREFKNQSDSQSGWSVSLAKIRREGFFYLENTGEEGVVETKAFRLDGPCLEVNADAAGSPGAALRVEILGEAGTPVARFAAADCDPLSSDGSRLPITWRGSSRLDELVGSVIKLRFLCSGPVKLYAFQVSAAP